MRALLLLRRLTRLFACSLAVVRHQRVWIAAFLPWALLLAQWMCEGAETALILALLGVDLDFVASVSTELTAVLLRSFAFLVPAGVGVQDAGYVAMFDALSGTRLATLGAAFVLIKRGKEIFWIGTGYALLLFARKQTASSSTRVKVSSRASAADGPRE